MHALISMRRDRGQTPTADQEEVKRGKMTLQTAIMHRCQDCLMRMAVVDVQRILAGNMHTRQLLRTLCSGDASKQASIELQVVKQVSKHATQMGLLVRGHQECCHVPVLLRK